MTHPTGQGTGQDLGEGRGWGHQAPLSEVGSPPGQWECCPPCQQNPLPPLAYREWRIVNCLTISFHLFIYLHLFKCLLYLVIFITLWNIYLHTLACTWWLPGWTTPPTQPPVHYNVHAWFALPNCSVLATAMVTGCRLAIDIDTGEEGGSPSAMGKLRSC